MSLCVRILFFLPVCLLAGVAGCGKLDQRVSFIAHTIRNSRRRY